MMRRIFSLLTPTWRPLLTATVFALAALVANVGLMATSAYLLSLAALHPPISALSTAIVGVRFFGLSRAVARYVERYAGHDAALRMLCEIRIWFYRSLEPLPPLTLAPFSSADLFTRMVADVESLKFLPVRIIVPAGAALIALFSITILLASLQWLLAVWVFSGLFAMSVLLPYLLQKMDKSDRTDFSLARSQFHATMLDSVRGLRDLSAFGRLELMSKRLHESHSYYLKAHCNRQKKEALGDASAGFIANLVFIGSLAMLVALLRNGRIEGIYLAAWALGLQSAFEAFYPLPLLRKYGEEIVDAAHRLMDVASSQRASVPAGTQLPTFPFTLTVSNVSFRYEAESAPALYQITFELLPGKRIAVVGSSGAGKSSLVSLLASLQTPESGSILLNGIALQEISPVAWQEWMGVVLQHDHLFHATIADNLRLARPDASDSDLWAAIDGVYLGEAIRKLPQLLETIIGEDGHGLSGGERRRLSLARALLKDAPLLLLDEPTAGLDPLLTRNLLAASSPLLRPGRTVLLVTHQLDGLQHMDEILVLEKGCIVEKGGFDELIQRNGLFYSLWSLQQDILTQVDKNSFGDES